MKSFFWKLLEALALTILIRKVFELFEEKHRDIEKPSLKETVYKAEIQYMNSIRNLYYCDTYIDLNKCNCRNCGAPVPKVTRQCEYCQTQYN